MAAVHLSSTTPCEAHVSSYPVNEYGQDASVRNKPDVEKLEPTSSAFQVHLLVPTILKENTFGDSDSEYEEIVGTSEPSSISKDLRKWALEGNVSHFL